MNTLTTRIKSSLLHPLTLIFIAWFAALISRLIKHGDVYGLNYNLFQPDGALYHALTVHLQGNSWGDSARLVNQFFQREIGTSYLGENIEPRIQTILLTRPLLSILSLPFVFLFGQFGMLVIPALSFLIIGIVIYAVGVKVGRPYLAVFIFFILTLSTSVGRWMVSDLTDGLLVALISILYLLIFRTQTKLPFILITALALLVRPSGPVLVAIMIPFAIAYKRIAIYFGIVISILGTVVLAIVSPDAAGTQTTGDYTVYQRIQDFALHGIKVFVVEFGQLFVMDRVLFIFIVLSTATAVLTWTNVYSKSYLALFITCFAMGAWNGALGVNFRYQLPLTIAAAIVILTNSNVIESQGRKLLRSPSQTKATME